MTASKIHRRLDRMDRIRRDLLDEVAALDPEERKARPISEKWSILEIVEHLVRTESDVLVSEPEGTHLRRTLKHRILYPVVMFVLRFDIPVRTPSRGMKPTGERSLEELRAEWNANHRSLRKRIHGLGEDGLKRPVAVHPIAGPMTPAQAVAMMDVHLRRHVRQIRERQELLRG